MQVENRYSRADRLVHRLAFNTRPAQVALTDLEDFLYSKAMSACWAKRPVFVTSLPRAGTTLLLELLAEQSEFASHSYRDMPFVLTPLLWNRMTGRHTAQGEKRERAHGDGVAVSVESPEAFEEVVWKTFWKSHYLADRIRPWTSERNRAFEEFFPAHMRKIIYLRRGNAAGARYLSKNNTNIARLRLLRRLFPDAQFLVPFRHPLQHAGSLLRQHQNFLKIQAADPFAKEYMSAIGHFEFGQDLRPIDFDEWIGNHATRNPLQLAFWLEYWLAAFQHVISSQELGLQLVSYEKLCREPHQGLRTLGETLEMADIETLVARADTIRATGDRQADATGAPAAVVKECIDLYADLLRVAAK